ncbi:Aste57867_21213 [Aphanomyces stellatus]|uniref:Aste57867_21213 protein n=1 Tax=Aphanomyces stellatus TaxID=120398 RepID=A0A485LH01_9STRA|nr:hypothetical protein As57867_021145 [Aphanomyces stellatus]VFT97885.1 Aste57867_21213 [Aphanomyces stellatus]
MMSVEGSEGEFTVAKARASLIDIDTVKRRTGYVQKVIAWLKANAERATILLDTTPPTINLDLFNCEEHLFPYLVWRLNKGDIEHVDTLKGYVGAVEWLYRCEHRQVPPEFTEASDVYKGLEKMMTKSVHLGKRLSPVLREMTWDEYGIICHNLLRLAKNPGFAHCFQTWTWNMMSRGISTAEIHTNHLFVDRDAIAVSIHMDKQNRRGKKPPKTIHIYANPLKPSVCSFLGLGVYLVCETLGPGMLFPGYKPQKRFYTILTNVLIDVAGGQRPTKLQRTGKLTSVVTAKSTSWEDSDDENESMDENSADEASEVVPWNVRVHSSRKGGATYATSGSTSGPSHVSVCHRAGWSIHVILSKYLQPSNAGDQQTGRTVSGLPSDSFEFATLPPHWCVDEAGRVDPVVTVWVELMFPRLKNEPHLVPVLRFALASLVHHFDYLARTMPRGHALFDTPLFRAGPDVVASLTPFLITGCTSPCIQVTGVPPYVNTMRDQKASDEKVEKLTNKVATLSNKVDDLHADAQSLKASDLVGGSIGPTLEQVSNVVRETVFEALSEMNALSTVEAHPVQLDAPKTMSHRDESPGCFKTYKWARGGKGRETLHLLPRDFIFPSLGVTLAWGRWWCGVPSTNEPPLHLCSTSDFDTKLQVDNFIDWRDVMNRLHEY